MLRLGVECTILKDHYHNFSCDVRTIFMSSFYSGADPGFLKGEGPGTDTGFFTSTPPPLGHCPRDVIHIPRGGGVITPVTHTHPGSATGVHLRSTSRKGGGPTLGPMLKSLHRGPKGGVRTPWTPPPGSATAISL